MKTNAMIFVVQSIRHPMLLAHSLAHRVRNDSLLRNSAYIMGTNIANAILGFIFWIAAARTYSTFDVGLASALISVMMLASAFSNMGIGSTMVQLLPGRKAGNDWSLTLNAGVTIAIFTGIPAGIILVVVLPLFSPQFAIVVHEIGFAFTLAVGVPLMTLSMMLDQTFVAERLAKYMLLRNLVVAVLKILLLLLPVLLFIRIGPLGIFSSGVLATTISLLVGWLLLIPRLGRAYRLATRSIMKQIRSMFSSLAGNHFINLGGLTPMYLLPLFVAMRLSPTDNAYYYTADKLDSFFFMASSVVAVALFAEGSHAVSTLTRKVRSSAVVVSIVLAPTMLICFFGGRYLLLLFGSNYSQHSLLLLRIFTIAAVPDAITNIYVSILRVQRRLRFAAFLSLGMAILTLVLGWMLLPILGIAGVGWAVLIAQGSGTLVAGADAIRFHSRRGSSVLTFQTAPDHVEAEV